MNASRVQNHKRFPQMFCELSTCCRSGSHYSNMRCLGFLKRQTQKILLHHLNAISFNKKRDKMKKKMFYVLVSAMQRAWLKVVQTLAHTKWLDLNMNSDSAKLNVLQGMNLNPRMQISLVTEYGWCGGEFGLRWLVQPLGAPSLKATQYGRLQHQCINRKEVSILGHDGKHFWKLKIFE